MLFIFKLVNTNDDRIGKIILTGPKRHGRCSEIHFLKSMQELGLVDLFERNSIDVCNAIKTCKVVLIDKDIKSIQ